MDILNLEVQFLIFTNLISEDCDPLIGFLNALCIAPKVWSDRYFLEFC